MPKIITESQVESACLEMLEELGYKILHGPDISEGGINEERKYKEVVLTQRLRDALERINKNIPKEAIEEAIKKVIRTDSQNQIINNQLFHKFITDEVPVEYKTKDGIKHNTVWLFDKDIKNNEFLAVNQFTIIEERNNRRPDIILFINGLPIVLIELKNPADENATIWPAFTQFQTYKELIPSIFRFNEILVISDGLEARAGTLTSNKERFTPWKTIKGEKIPKTKVQVEVLIKGMLNKEVLLDLIRHFIVFEIDKDKKDGRITISKKVAAYHQYHAVNKAVESTINAKDKPGGLVVDYIGIAYELKKALAEYTESDQKQTGIPQEEAVALMQEKYEIVVDLFHGFKYQKFFTVKPKEKMQIIAEAMEFVLKQKDGKERCLNNVTALSKAFALAVPHEEAIKIRDDVGFFQAVRSAIAKNTESKGEGTKDYESAINQILSKAIISDRVIDIFAAAGLKKPDISILSEEFLAEVKDMPQKNLAFEMLKKLLNDEIKIRQKKNLIQARSFTELLEKAIKAYTNKSIETAEVIEQLIDLARKMRDEEKRGQKLGLNENEVAFYDALVDHDGVREVMGDEKLMIIARELVEHIRKSVTIDWTMRENVQAQMRVKVKKILKKYGYPPDKQQKATDTVLEQAKLLCRDWAEITS